MRALLFISLLVVGCDTPSSPRPETKALSETPDPIVGPTGTISGRVTWAGPIPQTEIIRTYRPLPGGKAELVSRRAPNIPVVDASTNGVAGILVSLRGTLTTARPWDHPAVSLELSDDRPMVLQGAGPPRSIGLVRCGDEITMVSRQDRFHAVRARGAAFWTFTLPDLDRPIKRRLDKPGIVELSSGAGYYWMHAYLHVSEHPYCAVTDAAGRFDLPLVPPGEYELVTWLPSWEVNRRERDPESTALTRIYFGSAREWVRKLRVDPSQTAEVTITIPE